MRNQHESFLAIVGKVAQLDDFIKKQKEHYIEYRKRYFGDDKNPFDRKKQRKEGMLFCFLFFRGGISIITRFPLLILQ